MWTTFKGAGNWALLSLTAWILGKILVAIGPFLWKFGTAVIALGGVFKDSVAPILFLIAIGVLAVAAIRWAIRTRI